MQVQRSGFPVSLLKSDFILRYRWCAPASIPDSQLDPTKAGDTEKGENIVCETLLTLGRDLAGGGLDWGEGSSGWRLGRTKIFLKEAVTKGLEKARQAMWDGAAKVLQCRLRQKLAWRTLALVRNHKRLVIAARSATRAMDATAVPVA